MLCRAIHRDKVMADDPSVRCRRAHGFTLLELVLVVAIISIVGAIAVPRWTNATQRYELDMAAQRLASDISLAQSRANFSSTTVTLSFNLAANSYQIAAIPDPNMPGQPYTVNLAASPYNATISTISFASGATQLSFDGYGTPTGSGSITLSLAGRQHIVSIDASSGRATIQ